ncbi:phytanoyl-CoA dioxygenase 1 [Lingula anatina]|uniref:Phytanoyl-CoA dioxygenase 1 n=1 Tax=Lingula anatina TaxID=7574 RepID=A0A1S3HYP1_LINAN|nr:phytanoyl-CoA dioxygenase 1 [Lingula anatina]|eukprot:XP_013391128.1 phytanoyl-CoA dioxygenase 1 [Lingula anatina]
MAVEVQAKTFPGEVSETYPEPFTTIPPQPVDPKPGQLTEEQLKFFFSEGYLVVDKFFTSEELEPVKHAVAALVDGVAMKLFNAGKIKNLYTEYGLFERLTKLEEDFPGASIVMFKTGTFQKAIGDLWSNERLLNMMEQLVGPDVAGHPVWNLRTKTPKNNLWTIPWHQDSAYFSNDSYDHLIPTAWIPLLDTNAQNGGMQVVRRAHRAGKVARHTCAFQSSWYVVLDEKDIENTLGVNIQEDVITCDVPYGGFLLFHNLTPHRSLPNMSSRIRWSLDLRWQSPHQKWGFYDIAEGILFRSASSPHLTPDWKKFLSVNRKEAWQKKHLQKYEETDEFDTTVTGPWFSRWEITHRNRHTEAFRN